MPRITPVHYKVLVCIAKKLGFVFERQESSHIQYTKRGIKRPLTIPIYSEIDIDIIQSFIRTAGISRERYFELLNKCK
jgi:predicted RNA binding protein YcfA (HicA-like mRNA interferase family)